MDHRCGTRFSLSMAVELCASECVATPARLVVLSVTGAVVETRLRLAPLCPVLLRPAGCQDPELEIEAYVVRATERGVALEWAEPACDAVLALLPARVGAPAATAVVTGGISPAAA